MSHLVLLPDVRIEQGGIDTKALLGHLTDATVEVYANSRGLEPMKVRINGDRR